MSDTAKDAADDINVQPATANVSTDELFRQWKDYCYTDGSSSSTSDSLFDNEYFQALKKRGAKAVGYFAAKLKDGETFDFIPLGSLEVFPQISRTRLYFHSVATPENPKLTVDRCEEFPTMEIGRRVGQERELWLKWWAEKDKKIPVWFRGRYQMWQTAKKSGDQAKTEAAFGELVDLGIFALPQWMDKLQSDPKESQSIIAAISELTSGEVAATATPLQVRQWWKASKKKWTQAK